VVVPEGFQGLSNPSGRLPHDPTGKDFVQAALLPDARRQSQKSLNILSFFTRHTFDNDGRLQVCSLAHGHHQPEQEVQHRLYGTQQPLPGR
jgi:hypothetical protein